LANHYLLLVPHKVILCSCRILIGIMTMSLVYQQRISCVAVALLHPGKPWPSDRELQQLVTKPFAIDEQANTFQYRPTLHCLIISKYTGLGQHLFCLTAQTSTHLLPRQQNQGEAGLQGQKSRLEYKHTSNSITQNPPPRRRRSWRAVSGNTESRIAQ